MRLQTEFREYKRRKQARLSEGLDVARKKFMEFDVDGDGSIAGSELAALGEWVWASFSPAIISSGATVGDFQALVSGHFRCTARLHAATTAALLVNVLHMLIAALRPLPRGTTFSHVSTPTNQPG